MTNPTSFEARLTAAETRLDEVAAEAKAARHLAAARDRDLADLAVKVDANRSAINALGVQTAARFDKLERRVEAGFATVDARFATVDARFDEVDRGFAEMRARFDQTAAGMARIVELLTARDDR